MDSGAPSKYRVQAETDVGRATSDSILPPCESLVSYLPLLALGDAPRRPTLFTDSITNFFSRSFLSQVLSRCLVVMRARHRADISI